MTSPSVQAPKSPWDYCPEGALLAARIKQDGGRVVSLACSYYGPRVRKSVEPHAHRVTAEFPAVPQ